MRYDTTLKEICQTLPQILLQLLVGQEAVELLTIEFPSVKKRLPDLVVRLKNGSILHLELQSHIDERMVWRILEYYMLIRNLYPNTTVIQQVLYVGNAQPRFTTKIHENKLQFQYDLKDIRDIDCHHLLNSDCLEEQLLTILCCMEDERATIRQIVMRLGVLPPKERADAFEKLVILAGLRQLETAVKKEEDKMAISVNMVENAVLRNLFLDGEKRGEKRGEMPTCLHSC